MKDLQSPVGVHGEGWGSGGPGNPRTEGPLDVLGNVEGGIDGGGWNRRRGPGTGRLR